MTKILLGNVKGPKGDTGPQGKQGVQGPQGPCRRHWRDRGHRSERRGRPTRQDRVACLDHHTHTIRILDVRMLGF